MSDEEPEERLSKVEQLKKKMGGMGGLAMPMPGMGPGMNPLLMKRKKEAEAKKRAEREAAGEKESVPEEKAAPVPAPKVPTSKPSPSKPAAKAAPAAGDSPAVKTILGNIEQAKMQQKEAIKNEDYKLAGKKKKQIQDLEDDLKKLKEEEAKKSEPKDSVPAPKVPADEPPAPKVPGPKPPGPKVPGPKVPGPKVPGPKPPSQSKAASIPAAKPPPRKPAEEPQKKMTFEEKIAAAKKAKLKLSDPEKFKKEEEAAKKKKAKEEAAAAKKKEAEEEAAAAKKKKEEEAAKKKKEEEAAAVKKKEEEAAKKKKAEKEAAKSSAKESKKEAAPPKKKLGFGLNLNAMLAKGPKTPGALAKKEAEKPDEPKEIVHMTKASASMKRKRPKKKSFKAPTPAVEAAAPAAAAKKSSSKASSPSKSKSSRDSRSTAAVAAEDIKVVLTSEDEKRLNYEQDERLSFEVDSKLAFLKSKVDAMVVKYKVKEPRRLQSDKLRKTRPKERRWVRPLGKNVDPKEPVFWSGLLMKEGAIRKSWKERFFVVYADRMEYYEKQDDPKAAPKGTIHLAHGECTLSPISKREGVKEACIELDFGDRERKWHIFAPDEVDNEEFYCALSHRVLANEYIRLQQGDKIDERLIKFLSRTHSKTPVPLLLNDKVLDINCVETVCEILRDPNCQRVSAVEMRNAGLTTDMTLAIVKAVAEQPSPNTTRFDFSGNDLGSGGSENTLEFAKMMDTLLDSEIRLWHLMLQNCKINDNLLKATLKTVDQARDNLPLKQLLLNGNKISSQGVLDLLELLGPRVCKESLSTFGLSANIIGDIGARAIADTLGDAIKVVDLSHNLIGDAGSDALCNVAKSWPALVELDLSGNRNGGGKQILEVAREHQSLRSVAVGSHILDPQCIDALHLIHQFGLVGSA